MRHANSWALASATRCLFNKNKIGMADLKAYFEKNVIYVCERENGKIVFLSSSGGIKDIKVGTQKAGHNNATFASLGYLRVLNIIEVVQGQVVKSENALYVNDKAPLYVFK